MSQGRCWRTERLSNSGTNHPLIVVPFSMPFSNPNSLTLSSKCRAVSNTGCRTVDGDYDQLREYNTIRVANCRSGGVDASLACLEKIMAILIRRLHAGCKLARPLPMMPCPCCLNPSPNPWPEIPGQISGRVQPLCLGSRDDPGGRS